MKRIVKMLLISMLACALVFSAAAEAGGQNGQEDPVGSFFSGLWNSIGEIAENTWEEISDKAAEAWASATAWMNSAWGDAAKWVEQAWNDSSAWVTEIWGDVSTWATETSGAVSGSVGAWWAETFQYVTKSVNDAWVWIQEESGTLRTQYADQVRHIEEALRATGDQALEKVQAEFIALLKALHLNDEEAIKVWRTLQAYAKEKGLSMISVAKAALPYLLQLAVDMEARSDGAIPAVAVAQFLTSVVEKLEIATDAVLDDLLTSLIDALAAI